MNSFIVTGGAGFIGSHLCEALLKKGNNVICVDNFNSYYDPKIKEENIKSCIKNPNFKLYKVDIVDYSSLQKVFEENNCNAVIHLAARAGVRSSFNNPQLYEEVNVKGTQNLLELSDKFKIKKFIFGSSSSVYGNNKKIPFSEDDKTNNQVSPYASTKKRAELLCQNFPSINIIILRFFTVYGSRGRPDMAIYKFTKLINEGKEIEVYGNTHSKRDYTFISDIVKGILSALNKDFKFEIINLGGSNPVELEYLIKLIEKELNKKAKIKIIEKQKGDVEVTFADISRAKRLLNYEPKIKIGGGIKRFVKWFLEYHAPKKEII